MGLCFISINSHLFLELRLFEVRSYKKFVQSYKANEKLLTYHKFTSYIKLDIFILTEEWISKEKRVHIEASYVDFFFKACVRPFLKNECLRS